VEVSGQGAVLRAEGLHRFFHAGDDEAVALRDVSLEVAAGEMVAVVGPSGSGKSTLLSVLAGLDEPDAGWVTIAGQRLSRRPETERARLRARHVGLLFQSSNLVEHLTVEQNVVVAQRFGTRADRAPVGALLDELGLSSRRSARPSELSGGEAARAGLAVALANRPEVVLADEPTGEVDHATESKVLDLLRRRGDDGTAVLVVTHSDAVAGACDRRVRMADGRVVA
jgi:putative ABC transport system ATP-binding protein